MEAKTKLIFADYRLPEEAMMKLSNLGTLMAFDAGERTHPAIKGHPDLFLCPCEEKYVVAPNIPAPYLKAIQDAQLPYELGEKAAEKEHPAAARYNAICCGKTLIHKLNVTDEKLKALFDPEHQIDLPQAYARCSTLALSESAFITSDRGVEKALKKNGKEVLYVDPYPISLPGLPWGFFGGCCGIDDQTIYVAGSLRYFKEEKEIRTFCADKGYQVVELFEGSPFDGGGILFLS